MIKANLIASIVLAALLCPATHAADYLSLDTLMGQLREISKVAPKAGEVTSPFFCGKVKEPKPIELPKTKEQQTSELPVVQANREEVDSQTDKVSLEETALLSIPVGTKMTLAKAEALAWFSKFAKNESLFSFSDLNEMQGRLMSMSDDELKNWQAETKYVRDALESDEWATTSEWLSQFWKRQAMYKNGEVDALRTQLKQLPPDGILFVMDHFANQYIRKSNRLAFQQTRRGGIGVNPNSRIVSQRPTSGAGGNYPAAQPASTRATRRVITPDHLSSRVSRYYMYRGYNNYFWAYRPLQR